VAEASHGAAALEEARRDRPDLIIADILMPVMDGFALCRAWKQDAELRSVPFVFYTATYTDGRDRDFALSIGADEFIIKPQEPEALMARLRGILAAGAPRAAAGTVAEQEEVFLRQYNETLIRKLEDKMEQLERDIAARKQAEETLRESEEKYRLLVENAQEAIYVVQHGRVVFANAVFARLAELAESEVVGVGAEEFVAPEMRAAIVDHHRRLLAGEKAEEPLEIPIRTRKGTERWMSISAVQIQWKGQPATLNFAADITGRKQTEKVLQESEDRYRELFDNMTSGVAVYEARDGGRDFAFKDINRAGMVIDGIRREELIGRRVTEVFPGIAQMGLLAVFRRVWKTGTAEYFPNAHYVDGRLSHWYENHVYKLPSGEIVAVYDNVTEQKKAEEAQRESQTRFVEIFNANPTGMMLVDRTTRVIVQLNPAAAAMIGAPMEQLAGQICHGYICPAEAHSCPVCDLGQDIDRSERTLVRADGTRMPILKTVVPVLFNGKPFLLESFIDISEQKTAEAERERMQAQLNQAQKMESVGRLAGGVAHDFNNMLGVILGHAELAMEKSGPDHPLLGDLQEIRKAAERSADLTRQLLAFARKQTVSPRELDLNETVEGMLKMLRRLIGEDIDLAWRPGPNVGPVKVDPSQIDQILANLCVNARDAIGGAGQIAIETSMAAFDRDFCAAHPGAVPGEYVRLAVRDNGCGMDQETLGKLFEPFFTTKGAGEGTGLGLATVYGAVKQNNGFIDVESQPGMGSTFLIYLPCYQGKATSVPQERASERVSRGHETILLVEDEAAILSIGTTMLERLGYRVLGAATPGEALRLAEQHSGEIHLLMTDVVMPEMNGRDLAKGLLALYPRLKRLFMSGYTSDVIAHHGVLSDGVNFIQKPFTMKILAEKLREILDEG
jgi:two-component system, cell cycle sensor histidine kinase and response regulator CckA